MNDILFQLDLIWTSFMQNISDLDEHSCDRSILIRLWSIQFYLKSVLYASFKKGHINEYKFFSYGCCDVLKDIMSLHEEWITCIKMLSIEELHSTKYCKWPFDNRSFFSLALWVNVELMKHVTEISMLKEKNSGEPLL